MFTKEIITQTDARLDFNNQLCLKERRLTQLQVDRLNSRLDLAICGSTQSTESSHYNDWSH